MQRTPLFIASKAEHMENERNEILSARNCKKYQQITFFFIFLSHSHWQKVVNTLVVPY